jgi:phage-related protein
LRIHDFYTAGGKNVIKEYLSAVPEEERATGYAIRHRIAKDGVEALKAIKKRQIRGKLWEIKFSANRVMYVLADSDNIHFFHACKKQKGKAEKMDIDIAIQRAKERGFDI